MSIWGWGGENIQATDSRDGAFQQMLLEQLNVHMRTKSKSPLCTKLILNGSQIQTLKYKTRSKNVWKTGGSLCDPEQEGTVRAPVQWG
jgi:hypothetical protein